MTPRKKGFFPNWEFADSSCALPSELSCTALLRLFLGRIHFLYSQWFMHSSLSCWNMAPQLISISRPRARLFRSIS